MIEVLPDRQTVQTATQILQQQGLPTHLTPQKNWDQALLAQLLEPIDRQAAILDMGCGDCCTLDFLAALGFTSLHGIDLQIKDLQADKPESRPYQLSEGDLMHTPFADRSYEVLTSISVIEHGVDLNAFFAEADRLLKPNGILYVTTDYWETKIPIDSTIKPFGLSWQIFSREEIQQAIDLAEQHGLTPIQETAIPACQESPVSWYSRDYTFIALAFRKVG
ncbi:class I SAM-dependent methyltransferase [Leptolyngbya ohadii]|uniref:class I SAM-dependent methyltransferase n=1 Tax=Leptolyngbya ohadii TaxID=1962290 RepID=UPI0015C67C6F|nr:class I SAM-dependent methyltransferase [Leptolyngbya ohadii]